MGPTRVISFERGATLMDLLVASAEKLGEDIDSFLIRTEREFRDKETGQLRTIYEISTRENKHKLESEFYCGEELFGLFTFFLNWRFDYLLSLEQGRNISE